MPAMRILLSNFIVLSLLFLSMDGAADRVSVSHPHDDGQARQVDVTKSMSADTGTDVDPDEHDTHYCHGHVAGISVSFAVAAAPAGVADPRYGVMPYLLTYAQAPPTPPPNA